MGTIKIYNLDSPPCPITPDFWWALSHFAKMGATVEVNRPCVGDITLRWRFDDHENWQVYPAKMIIDIAAISDACACRRKCDCGHPCKCGTEHPCKNNVC